MFSVDERCISPEIEGYVSFRDWAGGEARTPPMSYLFLISQPSLPHQRRNSPARIRIGYAKSETIGTPTRVSGIHHPVVLQLIPDIPAEFMHGIYVLFGPRYLKMWHYSGSVKSLIGKA